jgi:hypothetical protein
MAALHYVSAYVAGDSSFEQMLYYTHHKSIAGLHYVSAYVVWDHNVE